MRQQSLGVRPIARVLGRSPSTISRELARNSPVDAAYGSHRAELACKARRRQARPPAKLSSDSLFWTLVMTLLDWKWSPQQIAATLKRL